MIITISNQKNLTKKIKKQIVFVPSSF